MLLAKSVKVVVTQISLVSPDKREELEWRAALLFYKKRPAYAGEPLFSDIVASTVILFFNSQK